MNQQKTRIFFRLAGMLLPLLLLASIVLNTNTNNMDLRNHSGIKLFLCGDIMTGRGIDQALHSSVDPMIFESYVKDARTYVQLAERENGPIDQPVSYSYLWGDALEVWKKEVPRLKVINLETSITTHNLPWPGKGINYRMHPDNIKVFSIAGIDYCALANNHILDWGRKGLEETLQTLREAGISCSGAGTDSIQALEPAIFPVDKGRVIIFSYGSRTSGIPRSWEATERGSGIAMLQNMDRNMISRIGDRVAKVRKPGDIVIFSVHWGGNWGYDIPREQRDFAHMLIDHAGVDLIHGHSSHHPQGLEVYNQKLIVYGAGDFMNDYEGIGGHEAYRSDLTLMYFPVIDQENGELLSMQMVPLQIRQFSLHRAGEEDTRWMQKKLDYESRKLGAGVVSGPEGSLVLTW